MAKEKCKNEGKKDLRIFNGSCQYLCQTVRLRQSDESSKDEDPNPSQTQFYGESIPRQGNTGKSAVGRYMDTMWLQRFFTNPNPT